MAARLDAWTLGTWTLDIWTGPAPSHARMMA